MAETHFEPVGRLRVQVSPAHKFGTDAFLLADFAAPRRRDTVCDLGTGCGIVALCWYRREETAPARVDCVDIQPAAIGQLTATLEENAGVLAGRIVPHLADLKALALPAGGYDLVTCNPPYKGAGAGSSRRRTATGWPGTRPPAPSPTSPPRRPGSSNTAGGCASASGRNGSPM